MFTKLLFTTGIFITYSINLLIEEHFWRFLFEIESVRCKLHLNL